METSQSIFSLHCTGESSIKDTSKTNEMKFKNSHKMEEVPSQLIFNHSPQSSLNGKKITNPHSQDLRRTAFLLEEPDQSDEESKKMLKEAIRTVQWKQASLTDLPGNNDKKGEPQKDFLNEKHLNETPKISYLTHANSNTIVSTSEGLGVEDFKVHPDLKTQVFHQLKLSNFVSGQSEKLEAIQFIEKHLNLALTESLTFQDPIQDSHLNPGQVDPSLLELQKMDKKSKSLLVGASFVNNYPRNNATGQINCDAYHVRMYEKGKGGNFAIKCGFSIVADGCGWGNTSRQAAQRAVAAAAHYIDQKLGNPFKPIYTAETLAYVLVQSLAVAHQAIVCDKQAVVEAGTTTMNICFAFRNPEGKKYLLLVGVGDCKSFIVTKETSKGYQAQEIVNSKRLSSDARDPGGRLGPYVGKNHQDPDLRNLSVLCMALPAEDLMILNMTDGVHDNFNPQQLGKDPQDIESSISPKNLSWSQLLPEIRLKLESSYQNQLLSSLMTQAANQTEGDLNKICECITSYCHEITSVGRKIMETDEKAREPKDKKENPGKMDHCTIVAFKF